MKTMAIRLDDEVSAQLTVIAQLEETSVAELIREAITTLIGGRRADGKLSAKADEVLVQIDREAADRRRAIEALTGPVQGPALPEDPEPSGTRARGRAKPADG